MAGAVDPAKPELSIQEWGSYMHLFFALISQPDPLYDPIYSIFSEIEVIDASQHFKFQYYTFCQFLSLLL